MKRLKKIVLAILVTMLTGFIPLKGIVFERFFTPTVGMCSALENLRFRGLPFAFIEIGDEPVGPKFTCLAITSISYLVLPIIVWFVIDTVFWWLVLSLLTKKEGNKYKKLGLLLVLIFGPILWVGGWEMWVVLSRADCRYYNPLVTESLNNISTRTIVMNGETFYRKDNHCGTYFVSANLLNERYIFTDGMVVKFVSDISRETIEAMADSESLRLGSNDGEKWVLYTSNESKYADSFQMAVYLEKRYKVIESAKPNYRIDREEKGVVEKFIDRLAVDH